MFKVVKKDLLLFFGDKKAVFLTFLMPIGLITLFVFAFGGTGTKSDRSPLVICIADEDQSLDSKSIIEHFNTTSTFSIIKGEWQELSEKVKRGKYSVALKIRKDFLNEIEKGNFGFELIYDEAREAESSMTIGLLTGELFALTGKNNIKNKVLINMQKQFGEADEETMAMIVENIDEMMMNDDFTANSSSLISSTAIKSADEINPSLIHAVAGTSVMTLLFAVAAIGAGLLDEKEKGTLKKLILSPINPIQLLFGKLGSAVIIGVLQLLTMLIFAYLVFQLPIFNHLSALILLIIATAFACASFGVLLASFCTSRKQIEGLSTITVLVMSALGGSMMPLFFMPSLMQKFSMFTVNYWSIQGFYDIFWREFEWSELMVKVLFLLGIAALMILIAVPFYRKNILKLA